MKYRILAYALIPLISGILWSSCKKEAKPEAPKTVNVLIYSKTKGSRHECIEPGGQAIIAYFAKHGVTATMTEDSSVFTHQGLKPYDVIMFFQTTGNVLDSAQQLAFEQFIKSGKGFVGVHAASDTEYEWPWYGKLIGAYFSNHPDIQSAALVKVDTGHISCKHLPARWTRTDEWYNFKKTPTGVNVLLTIDEATYTGGTHGAIHPMSWYHMVDGGRSFYTALGHTVESYQEQPFLEHILRGTQWAAGK